MKRLFRMLFNAATVVSLLLCIGTAALWGRSNWLHDQIQWCSGQWVENDDWFCRALFLDSSEGRLHVSYLKAKATRPLPGVRDGGDEVTYVSGAGCCRRQQHSRSNDADRWHIPTQRVGSPRGILEMTRSFR